MRIHTIQHVAFEGLGCMQPYLEDKGHDLSFTHLYAGESLPNASDMDALIIMGGPMGIYDDVDLPWLNDEKVFIKQVIDAGKKVLGICLGAQLIADVLGSTDTKRAVYAGKHKEIGWFSIQKSPELENTILDDVFPASLEVFHWHGDMFDVPNGAQALAASAACPNQGFLYQDRVVAFQFHLETTPESAGALIEHCGDELDASLLNQDAFVQSAEEILGDEQRFATLNQTMFKVLARIIHKSL
ncbi:MAG TPA: type 1 glutamine amidotransferase, partial [Ghiorsea sp.]|nr:type 1 glutamine amidotransferase [Ghiorsea sp.]